MLMILQEEPRYLQTVIELFLENPLSVITAVTAILSVVISVFTLIQNSKMIEESSRPYLTAEIVHIGTTYYLRFKNYGKTAATIDSIKLNDNAKKVQLKGFKDVYEDFCGSTIPPNYSFMTCILQDNVSGEENSIVIDIQYHSSVKKYKEHIQINLSAYKRLLEARRNIDDENASIVIGKTLQDLVFAVEKR